MNVFQIDFGYVGLERHQGGTGSSRACIAVPRCFFVVLVWNNLTSALQCLFSPVYMFLNNPRISNVQRQSNLMNINLLRWCLTDSTNNDTLLLFESHIEHWQLQR